MATEYNDSVRLFSDHKGSYAHISEEEGTNVRFTSDIHMQCLSCLMVLQTLSLPSSAVCFSFLFFFFLSSFLRHSRARTEPICFCRNCSSDTRFWSLSRLGETEESIRELKLDSRLPLWLRVLVRFRMAGLYSPGENCFCNFTLLFFSHLFVLLSTGLDWLSDYLLFTL